MQFYANSNGGQKRPKSYKINLKDCPFRSDVTFAPPRKHRMTFGKGQMRRTMSKMKEMTCIK